MGIKIAKKEKLDGGVKFAFADKAETSIEYLLKDLTKPMIQQLAIHGLSQKLGDSYSGVESVAEAMQVCEETWKNLLAGNFNARVQSSGGVFAEAIARIKGISVEEAAAAIQSLDDEARDRLMKNVTVKSTMVVIRGEKARARLDGLDEVDIGI